MHTLVESIKLLISLSILLIICGFLLNLFFKCTFIGRLCWEIGRSIFLLLKVTFGVVRNVGKYTLKTIVEINKHLSKKHYKPIDKEKTVENKTKHKPIFE